jgi:copper chaperone CopZ
MTRSSKYKSILQAAFISLCALALLLTPGCSSDDGKSDEPQSRLMKVTFSVPDMCCSSCAAKSKMALEKFDGVEKAYANFLEKQAWARYDPSMVEVERLRRSVQALGFKEVTIVTDERYVPEPISVPE